MAAPSLRNELKAQLREAGNKLSMPPSFTKELLDLLDRTEELLSHVGQTPYGSIPDAILPVMGALKSDQLLKHPDVDVKVSVASCLSEITRISAPETPYNDEIMKEMFQLYLMAFGKLSHSSGRCYSKALHILESTAWVHSCLLMLDLEFDDIIVAMFQLFLATIRSSHPPSVFSNMEAIMTLTIEESDEVSSDFLKLLLSSVEKNNQNVSPISWKLGEKVLSNCAGILEAYLPEVMRSMRLNPRNYADVVATICQDAPPKANVAEHHSTDVDSSKEIDQSADESSKSAMDKDSENKSSGNMLGSCHQNEHQTSTSQRALSPTEMEQPELGAELPKKRERKPSSWLDGYLLIEESEFEASHPKKKGDGPDLLLGDTRGAAGPSAQKVKDEKCKKGKATSGQKGPVSPFATTSTKRGGGHSSEAFKRKAIPHEEKDSRKSCKMNEYGEELVGRRIKVWWPLDQMFYNGAIVAFNPSEKKHTVCYDDGDEELLNLREEQWELLRDVSPDEEQSADPPYPDASPDKYPQTKRK